MFMKRLLLLVTTVLFIATSFGASTPSPKPRAKASEILIPIGNSGQKISLLDLSRMSVKDVEAYTGKKMKWIDRVGFKTAQRELRKSINRDGTLDSKKFERTLKKADITEGFHIGGFALGFFLTIIGVLIAYLINDDKKATRVKWAWIGFAVSLVLILIFAII